MFEEVVDKRGKESKGDFKINREIDGVEVENISICFIKLCLVILNR